RTYRRRAAPAPCRGSSPKGVRPRLAPHRVNQLDTPVGRTAPPLQPRGGDLAVGRVSENLAPVPISVRSRADRRASPAPGAERDSPARAACDRDGVRRDFELVYDRTHRAVEGALG